VKTKSKKFYLVTMAVASVVLIIVVIYFVRSGSYIYLMKFKNWFIIPAILLVSLCLFLVRKAYIGFPDTADRKLQFRARMMILFLGISSGFAGLAQMFYLTAYEKLSWVLMPLYLLGFLSFLVAFIFTALLSWKYMKQQ